MSWTDGVDRATGDLITSTDWNGYLGASGSLQGLKAHAHSGAAGDGSASLEPLILAGFIDAAAPAAPSAGRTRFFSTSGWPQYRAAGGAAFPMGDKRQSLGSVSGAVTVDLSLGSNVDATITGATTFTFTNMVAGVWYAFTLTMSGGSWTITWPSAGAPTVEWANGGAAPASSASGKTDLYSGYALGTTKLLMGSALNYT